MKKILKPTVLKKYLSAFLLILFISFFTLGMMLYFFVSNYKTEEKKELLTRNVNNIAITISRDGVEKTADSNLSYKLKNETFIKSILNSTSENIGADVFITDLQGKILLYSNDSGNIEIGNKIPGYIIDQVKTGQYVGVSTLGSVYSYDCYSVGIPIKFDETTVGTIFISSSAKNMNNFGKEVTKLFFLAALIACLIAFVIIWLLSYKMVRPIKSMTVAARAFGKGDFSQRVKVKNKDELGELAQSFNNMADSIEQSEKVRKNFIANVSHELKTPMTTISGFVDGMLDGTIKEDRYRYYLSIVSDEVKRLSRLVRSMLNLSKIDDDKIELHKTSFEILSLTLNILALFEEKIVEKNISIKGLENSTSVYVKADYDMIYQVIYNLLENATKFVNEKGYIKISISKEKGNVIFSVRNSGEGISQEDIKLVFDRFYKTDKSRSKDKTGVGLGLSIVKKIINLHGGNIKAESIEGQECNFEFNIPIQ